MNIHMLTRHDRRLPLEKCQMRTLVLYLFVAVLPCMASAQALRFSMEGDSTFNAAEDYARTAEGFDVDVRQKNVINLGVQIAQDVAVANANAEAAVNVLSARSYYRQRADLLLSSALPERTNVYANLSFVNTNSDNAPVNVFVSNLEIEHFFRNHCKIRVGRLANAVSESQFFGRMALEPSSAHVYGRKLFINDALEFDGNLMHRGGPVYFIGLKPCFKPFNIKGAYAGLHQRFKRGWQVHAIMSVNRQFEADLQPYFSDFRGKQAYFSWELEAAHKSSWVTGFVNLGSNVGFMGRIPHTDGSFDFIQALSPVVERKGDSFKQTFTPATGFRLFPSKANPSLDFWAQFGLEAEVQGVLSDSFTAFTVCAYCRLNITRRLVLTYYCTPQFVWQDFDSEKPGYMGGVVNFLRLSVTVGAPKRMFL